MLVWSVGGIAMLASTLSPLAFGIEVTPIGYALGGLFAIQSVLCIVAARSFRRHLVDGREPSTGLVALGIWLVLAALATVAFTFDVHAPDIEELQ